MTARPFQPLAGGPEGHFVRATLVVVEATGSGLTGGGAVAADSGSGTVAYAKQNHIISSYLFLALEVKACRRYGWHLHGFLALSRIMFILVYEIYGSPYGRSNRPVARWLKVWNGGPSFHALFSVFTGPTRGGGLV